MQLELALEIGGQPVAGEMQEQPGGRLRHRDDVRNQLLRRAGSRHHHLEAQRARLGRRRPADGEQRQLARLPAQRMRFQGAQRVAAGGDQRLHAVELDRVGVFEGDAEQRLDGRLVAMLLQRSSELERVGLGAGDEEAHRLERAKEVGPRLG